MIRIYDSFAGFKSIKQTQKGCWVHVVEPSEAEIQSLKNDYAIPDDVLQDVLDVDERPRVEFDDDWTLIIFRIPIPTPENGVPYQTIPLAIFVGKDFTITICQNDNEVLPAKQPSLYKDHYKSIKDGLNFLFKISLKSSKVYLQYLKAINQQTAIIEDDLEKSIRNEELSKLLRMEKSLVYFITSLKGNELVISKFAGSRRAPLSEINEDLLEDTRIENKQAIEMAQIYSDIQSGMMDAFASVISNNLNTVMKQLASISIILMIPTLVASLYGMNVPNYFESNVLAFPLILIISAFLAFVGIIIFRKRDWF